MTTYLNFIDGNFVRGSGEAYANHFPSTGAVIGEISAAGKSEVDAAVGAARAASRGLGAGCRFPNVSRFCARWQTVSMRASKSSWRPRYATPGNLARSLLISTSRAARQFQRLRRPDPDRLDGKLRNGHPGRCRGAQLCAEAAPWRHRCRVPVELAASPDDVEGRSRARLRQHGGGQAIGGNPGNGDAARRGDERGGNPRGVYNVVHGTGPEPQASF